jgi:hypothetical protein
MKQDAQGGFGHDDYSARWDWNLRRFVSWLRGFHSHCAGSKKNKEKQDAHSVIPD